MSEGGYSDDEFGSDHESSKSTKRSPERTAEAAAKSPSAGSVAAESKPAADSAAVTTTPDTHVVASPKSTEREVTQDKSSPAIETVPVPATVGLSAAPSTPFEDGRSLNHASNVVTESKEDSDMMTSAVRCVVLYILGLAGCSVFHFLAAASPEPQLCSILTSCSVLEYLHHF